MEDKKMKTKKKENETEDWYDVTDRELDYGFDDREGK